MADNRPWLFSSDSLDEVRNFIYKNNLTKKTQKLMKEFKTNKPDQKPKKTWCVVVRAKDKRYFVMNYAQFVDSDYGTKCVYNKETFMEEPHEEYERYCERDRKGNILDRWTKDQVKYLMKEKIMKGYYRRKNSNAPPRRAVAQQAQQAKRPSRSAVVPRQPQQQINRRANKRNNDVAKDDADSDDDDSETLFQLTNAELTKRQSQSAAAQSPSRRAVAQQRSQRPQQPQQPQQHEAGSDDETEDDEPELASNNRRAVNEPAAGAQQQRPPARVNCIGKKVLLRKHKPNENDRFCARRNGQKLQQLTQEQLKAEQQNRVRQRRPRASSASNQPPNSNNNGNNNVIYKTKTFIVSVTLPDKRSFRVRLANTNTFQTLQERINKKYYNYKNAPKHYLYLNGQHIDKHMLERMVAPVLKALDEYKITVSNVSPFDNNPSYNTQRRPAPGPRKIIGRHPAVR